MGKFGLKERRLRYIVKPKCFLTITLIKYELNGLYIIISEVMD